MSPCKFSVKFLFAICIMVPFADQLIAQSAKEEPPGKVWGYGFTDFYHKAGGDTATWSSRAEYSGVPKDVYAFAIRRMYLGYDYNISRTFSTQVILEGGDNFLTTRGDRSVTIKTLYLRWKGFFKGT